MEMDIHLNRGGSFERKVEVQPLSLPKNTVNSRYCIPRLFLCCSLGCPERVTLTLLCSASRLHAIDDATTN